MWRISIILVLITVPNIALPYEVNFDKAIVFTAKSCSEVNFMDETGVSMDVERTQEWSVDFYSEFFGEKFESFEDLSVFVEREVARVDWMMLSLFAVRSAQACVYEQYLGYMYKEFGR